MTGARAAAALLQLLAAAAAQQQQEGTEAPSVAPVPVVNLGDREESRYAVRLRPGYAERVSLEVAPGVGTLEIILLVSDADVTLDAWRQNTDASGGPPRWEYQKSCRALFDSCVQQAVFQYTRPSFVPAGSRYSNRLAVRIHPMFGHSLTGRWELLISNSFPLNPLLATQPAHREAELVIYQRSYTYWGVVAPVLLSAAAALCFVLAACDLVWMRRGQVRVIRPAQSDGDAPTFAGQVRTAMVALRSAVQRGGGLAARYSPLRDGDAAPGGGFPPAPPAGAGGGAAPRGRLHSRVVDALVVLVQAALLAAVLLVLGFAAKGTFAVLTGDGGVMWSPANHYHFMLGLAVLLALMLHSVMLRTVLVAAVPSGPARGVALALSALLEIPAGYAVSFVLWMLNSAVWDWQVSYCSGFAAVCVYYLYAHNEVVTSFGRWQQTHRREVVVEPPAAVHPSRTAPAAAGSRAVAAAAPAAVAMGELAAGPDDPFPPPPPLQPPRLPPADGGAPEGPEPGAAASAAAASSCQEPGGPGRSPPAD